MISSSVQKSIIWYLTSYRVSLSPGIYHSLSISQYKRIQIRRLKFQWYQTARRDCQIPEKHLLSLLTKKDISFCYPGKSIRLFHWAMVHWILYFLLPTFRGNAMKMMEIFSDLTKGLNTVSRTALCVILADIAVHHNS